MTLKRATPNSMQEIFAIINDFYTQLFVDHKLCSPINNEAINEMATNKNEFAGHLNNWLRWNSHHTEITSLSLQTYAPIPHSHSRESDHDSSVSVTSYRTSSKRNEWVFG